MYEQVELRRKTGQRGLLITSYKRLEKSLIGPNSFWQRQFLSLHTWRHQGPCNPSSCATFTLNPHWGRAASGKNQSCIYARRVASVMSNSL